MLTTEQRDALSSIPAEKFKLIFLEWFAESEHQGWEGFAPESIEPFQDDFLGDFIQYASLTAGEERAGWFEFGTRIIDASTNGDV